MENSSISEINRNKLLAIKKILLKHKEEMQIEHIRSYSEKHNITNITLLRRFANPVRDPDPLSSTMISMSYKYPIVMKKDWLQTFPTNWAHGEDSLIEGLAETRRPGWIGCKKELVAKYLDIAEIPTQDQVDIIDILYHNDRKKVKQYYEMDWKGSEVHLGKQIGEKVMVKLNNPIIPNIKQSDILPLLCKLLSPGITCNERIQRIYNENKNKLMSSIPKHVGISEQANALRNLLDPKERMIPVLSTHFNSEFYQHTTSLFSSNWQVVVNPFSLDKEEGVLPTINHYDLEALCERFLWILNNTYVTIPVEALLRNLNVQGTSMYELINDYQLRNTSVLYLRGILGFTFANEIFIEGRHSKIHLRPQGVYTQGLEEYQQIHFKANMTEGSCLLRSSTLSISMKWAPQNIILEILYLFAFLIKQKIDQRMPENIVEEMWEYGKSNKLSRYILSGELSHRAKSAFLLKQKLELGTINYYRITTLNSPFEIMIDDNSLSLPAKEIEEVTVDDEIPPLFKRVNGIAMYNVSHFLSKNTEGKGQCATSDIKVLLTEETVPFLQMIEFKARYEGAYLSVFTDPELEAKIESLSFPCFGYYFRDQFEESQRKSLGFLCASSLKVIKAKKTLSSTARELLAFYFLWADHTVTGSVSLEYTFKNGIMIDLNFKNSTQHQKNLLWIDEDDSFMILNRKLGKSLHSPRNEAKLLLIQGQIDGFKLSLVDTAITEKKVGFEEAKRLLGNKKDGESLFAQHMGLVFKITRDRAFSFSVGKSGARITQSLKRLIYLDSSRLETLGPEKKKVKR
uniref:PB2 n=1 Tax=Mason Creek virus TaxID=2651593 RepID=A0A5P8HZJ4_9VIRU|nr:PB2 [Mason Creek virus]